MSISCSVCVCVCFEIYTFETNLTYMHIWRLFVFVELSSHLGLVKQVFGSFPSSPDPCQLSKLVKLHSFGQMFLVVLVDALEGLMVSSEVHLVVAFSNLIATNSQLGPSHGVKLKVMLFWQVWGMLLLYQAWGGGAFLVWVLEVEWGLTALQS